MREQHIFAWTEKRVQREVHFPSAANGPWSCFAHALFIWEAVTFCWPKLCQGIPEVTVPCGSWNGTDLSSTDQTGQDWALRCQGSMSTLGGGPSAGRVVLHSWVCVVMFRSWGRHEVCCQKTLGEPFWCCMTQFPHLWQGHNTGDFCKRLRARQPREFRVTVIVVVLAIDGDRTRALHLSNAFLRPFMCAASMNRWHVLSLWPVRNIQA